MGDDGSPSVLRHNIIELELKLEEEKDRYRDLKSHLKLSKLAASQEIDNQRRVCLMQREVMARLQEDNKTLREREARDQETLKCLLEEMAKKDRDFREKLLEFECGEKRAQCEVLEWKSKYCELEARVSRLIGETVAGFERKEREIQEKIFELAEENRNLKIRALMVSEGNCYYDFKGKEINVEENPRPIEKEKERTSEIGEEDEDEVPLSHLIKKRLADASHSSKEFFASQKPSEPGRNGGKRVPSGGEDVHTPLESAIKQQQESNIVSNSRKTFKLTDLSSSVSARNPGSTGFNGVVQRGDQSYSKSTGNPRVYTGRTPTLEQPKHAEKRAQVLQRSLRTPSFIRSMALSHVSSCFWISLPTKFCKENLPALDLKMILEDERGSEYAVNYFGSRTAFSGGWRGFALAHTLELGDTLVFELLEPTRFKIYIIKAISQETCEEFDHRITG
ncbi:uncharacterized protein LOC109822281 isoform X1 [Asparagus officinalis]|uniref:uncharacterized protein LOC109822281 isoform X1 n=1 Tax=Asparagus officinalis TaxID=4686 RepID=UPI00098E826C|nr:uncharacterized protein LOC109822281 isoform X1 [Asparagus officinalis]